MCTTWLINEQVPERLVICYLPVASVQQSKVVQCHGRCCCTIICALQPLHMVMLLLFSSILSSLTRGSSSSTFLTLLSVRLTGNLHTPLAQHCNVQQPQRFTPWNKNFTCAPRCAPHHCCRCTPLPSAFLQLMAALVLYPLLVGLLLPCCASGCLAGALA
jgi:hypothetical protein